MLLAVFLVAGRRRVTGFVRALVFLPPSFPSRSKMHLFTAGPVVLRVLEDAVEVLYKRSKTELPSELPVDEAPRVARGTGVFDCDFAEAVAVA